MSSDNEMIAMDDDLGMVRHKLTVWDEDSPYYNLRVTIEGRTGADQDDSMGQDVLQWAAGEAAAAVQRVIESYRNGERPPTRRVR